MICVCAALAGLTFPARRRLRRKSDFEAAYSRGKRMGNGYFGVVAIGNQQAGPRLGLAVAVHVAGNAVERNRLRRIIRESFRLHQHELPAIDLVVSARSRARNVEGAKLHESLVALWRNVADQYRLGRQE